ncbi:NAD(P)-binding protein [Periconia macrospinosa]|uniref:NAD(P)-binding protein n=1 Tax=Periconia macrospinosa TaxID=97972 RepID=A0A2V1E2S2_9PLEO|nr:NAD(P)-binding protein [Periconia macrospinosa]
MATNKTIVLVTGANTGIGYETVKALYESSTPHTILMGSRSLDKAHEAIKKIQTDVPSSPSEILPVQIDIEDDASIEKLSQFIESTYGKLDALVNNAGGSFDRLMFATPTPTPNVIRSAWSKTYSLNVTSTEVLTQTLAPLLLKSTAAHARLLFITSGLSSLTEVARGRVAVTAGPVSPGWPKNPFPSQITYRASKVALNMLMLEWERVLQVDGVKVFCISPGFLATGLGGVGKEKLASLGAAHPEVGGRLIRDVVEGRRDEDAGKVVAGSGMQEW